MTSRDLLVPAMLKALCERADMRPEKSSGQNFLVSATALERIITAVDPQPGDTILEVGAGFGVLTLALAERGAHVIALERDRRIVPMLRDLVAPYENVEVVEGDILALWRETKERRTQERRTIDRSGRSPFFSSSVLRPDWKLAANLPYSITSDFLRLLFDRIADGSLPVPERVILLLQREVVDRLTADPRKVSDRGAVGILTLLAQLHCTPRRVARVPPGSFWPPPKVESAVVVLDAWRTPEEIEVLLRGAPPPLAPPPGGKGRKEREKFLRLIHAAFSRRRGQLLGILRRYTKRSREDVEQVFGTLRIDPAARPETLTIEQWIRIAQALQAQAKQ